MTDSAKAGDRQKVDLINVEILGLFKALMAVRQDSFGVGFVLIFLEIQRIWRENPDWSAAKTLSGAYLGS